MQKKGSALSIFISILKLQNFVLVIVDSVGYIPCIPPSHSVYNMKMSKLHHLYGLIRSNFTCHSRSYRRCIDSGGIIDIRYRLWIRVPREKA